MHLLGDEFTQTMMRLHERMMISGAEGDACEPLDTQPQILIASAGHKCGMERGDLFRVNLGIRSSARRDLRSNSLPTPLLPRPGKG